MELPDIGRAFMELQSGLSDSIVTIQSLRGILMLVILVGILIRFAKNLAKGLVWCFCFLFLWQILHIISCETVLGTWVPILRSIFPYDVFVTLAQLCVGTPVATVLLWLQAFLNETVGTLFRTIFWVIQVFWEHFSVVF